jgi:hypothetical protein
VTHSKQQLVYSALMKLGGAASGRQIADILGWPGDEGVRRVGQLMRYLIPSHVERIGHGAYKAKATSLEELSSVLP